VSDNQHSEAQDGAVVKFPPQAGVGTEPSYEVLGPAPPGRRCICCGASSGGVKVVKRGGATDFLHEACARAQAAAMANPPVELPDLGPDPLDDHGAPRPASKE
jgi:hypothetical protein